MSSLASSSRDERGQRKHRDFLSELDFSREEVIETLALARELKEMPDRPDQTALQLQTWGLIFHKPSLRTRTSFEVAINQLGGKPIYITEKEIELGKRESIADAARVLSRYLGGIVIRTFSHKDVEELAKYADIPVINALTDLLHPCQIFSDILTIYEHLGRFEDFKIVYLGDGNNITNSWLNLASLLRFQLVVATSGETLPDMGIFERVRKAGAAVSIVEDPFEAVKGADVLYTDVWASMGQKDQAAAKAQALQAFQINSQLVSRTGKEGTIVMHCLPAERGKEITDDVMDGPHSVVFDQAENRLHMQKAIILRLLEN